MNRYKTVAADLIEQIQDFSCSSNNGQRVISFCVRKMACLIVEMNRPKTTAAVLTKTMTKKELSYFLVHKKNSMTRKKKSRPQIGEYDQEIPQSQTANIPMAPR